MILRHKTDVGETLLHDHCHDLGFLLKVVGFLKLFPSNTIPALLSIPALHPCCRPLLKGEVPVHFKVQGMILSNPCVFVLILNLSGYMDLSPDRLGDQNLEI